MSAVTSDQEALELVYRGQGETVAYACPKCGMLITSSMFGGADSGDDQARRTATEHCQDKLCTCGGVLKTGYSICSACWQKKQDAKELKRFEVAEKLTEYDGPVYWEDREGSLGDGYFISLDEVLDYCEDNDFPKPAYVWACNPVELSINVENILEGAFQGHHEGARDMLEEGAEEELQSLIGTWCKKQNIKSWEVDYKRAVLLDP